MRVRGDEARLHAPVERQPALWRDDAGRMSEDYFLCDLYLLDDAGADEVADALIHMLEE